MVSASGRRARIAVGCGEHCGAESGGYNIWSEDSISGMALGHVEHWGEESFRCHGAWGESTAGAWGEDSSWVLRALGCRELLSGNRYPTVRVRVRVRIR